MFEKLKFRSVYRKLKSKQKLDGGWEFSLSDIELLLSSIPKKMLRHYTFDHTKYLSRYRGELYHPTPEALLEAVRMATDCMRKNIYLETPSLELVTYDLSRWLQPDFVLFDYYGFTESLEYEFRNFVTAYRAVPKARTGYYQRKSSRIISDVFSYAEMIADTVLAEKQINAKTR